jgi:RNA polymerase sigma-70 factor (ECF subfamily)
MLPWLVSLAQQRVRGEEAQDIAQEAAFKFWKALPTFDATKSGARTFARIILHNHATSVQRARRRREHLPLQAVTWAVAGSDPGAEAELREAREELRQALSRIDPREAEALLLRYDSGLSYQVAAEMTRVPAGTVASRVHRGKQSIRNRLLEHGRR